MEFLTTMAGVEFSFDWFSADSTDIALFSSGRLPVRAPGHRSGAADGRHRRLRLARFLTFARHAHGIDPPAGVILNRNDKPAAGVGAADSNWSYGSVQRVQLLQQAVAAKQRHTLASLVAAMNLAATQELRPIALLPDFDGVLGRAPSARDGRLFDLLNTWFQRGAPRLDANGDGKVGDRPRRSRARGTRGSRTPSSRRCSARSRRGSLRSTRAPTTRTPAIRRSTRTCAGCSAGRFRVPSRATAAGTATSRRAAPRSGLRSRPPTWS
jgi:Penicillin amidase